MANKMSKEGLELLERLEERRLKAYQDTNGTWTIGVGHTGEDVYEGAEITEEECDDLLAFDVSWVEDCLNEVLPQRIKQNQFDALACFTFNVGEYAFRNSTLLKYVLSDGTGLKAADEFKRWKYETIDGRKQVNRGLEKRRNAESCLFYSGNYTKWV